MLYTATICLQIELKILNLRTTKDKILMTKDSYSAMLRSISRTNSLTCFAASAMLFLSCGPQQANQQTLSADTVMTRYQPGTFGYDRQQLRLAHPDLIELSDIDKKSRVVIAPAYQARVMTSTAAGDEGYSFGWINHALIASGDSMPHIHAYGGEERFWLGPEGGQFSIYFKKGVPFEYANWQVPKEIDTERFNLVSASPLEARFEKDMHIENYSGTALDLKVNRDIRLLNSEAIANLLGVHIGGQVETVGFETSNTITNTGNAAWSRETGMLSVWILSMLNASDSTTVAIPYVAGDEKSLGKVVTDDYFGKVPSDRLGVTDHLILFKADGNYRSKIGVSPKRAKPVVASYDAAQKVLTIALFSLPSQGEYVNSKWEIQKNPFEGDAINSYNDGPVNGSQMGKLYEIESSSPAAALAPGASLTHRHTTIHLQGDIAELDKVAQKLLGVTVQSIAGGLSK